MNERFTRNCLCTFTRRPLDPFEPRPENISREDIAHALSLICRSNGHTKHFYSVAQHSLNCAAEALARGWGDRLALACLLHDASEAYIADIVRPVKHRLDNYLEIEAILQNAIFQKYGLGGLSGTEKEKIRSVDDRMLRHEFFVLFDMDLFLEDSPLLSQPDLSLRPFDAVEKEFLDLFARLCPVHEEAQNDKL